MLKGTKPELVPLLREDRHVDFEVDGFALLSDGTKADIGDPQFNGLLFPQLRWVVFYDRGDKTLGSVFFVRKEVAQGWCEEKLMGILKGEKI